MFKDIVKEYQKGISTEKFFDLYYWIIAIIILMIDGVLFFKVQLSIGFSWLVVIISFLVLSLAVLFYMLYQFLHLKGKNKDITEFHGFKTALQSNIKTDRIQNLLYVLKDYHFKTKEDIQYMIDYLYHQLPIKVKGGSFATWISAWIAIASLLLAASNINETNFELVVICFSYSTIFLIIPYIAIAFCKFLFNHSPFFHNKQRDLLLEDLIYIQLYYDDYKHILLEEVDSPSLSIKEKDTN